MMNNTTIITNIMAALGQDELKELIGALQGMLMHQRQYRNIGSQQKVSSTSICGVQERRTVEYSQQRTRKM